jgi:mannan endo-1,4-beta-mannosidase
MVYSGYSVRAACALVLCLGLVAGVASAANTGFVSTNGAQFEVGGQPHYFTGANFWQGMNLAADGASGDRPRLGRELDRLQAAGVTNVRVMASSEGPNTEPYRMVPSLQTSPGVYDADVFAGLDYLLDELDQRDMRAVMVLNNFWHWSGGMAQYVSWNENTPIPYPNDTGDWGTYQNYAKKFYTNSDCQDQYKAHIATVVGRVNSVNGKTYENDPTIFSWELANEPRRYPAEWIDDTAAYIKSLDSNHMVTTGSEGRWGAEGGQDRDFVPTHDGPDIDYATCHIWPQNWGWYNPADPNSYSAAEANAIAYLQDHLEDSENVLDKPLVLEEFGLARDWDPLHDIHDPDSPTSYRDQFFEAMFDEVYASALDGGAGAGDNIWAYGGEGRPGDPAPQWIGDPPHEEPGWYSVYDTDANTLALMSSHAAEMNSLVPEPSSFKLTITPTASNPGNYDFEWESQDGKLYDLVSDTGLATATGTWSVWNSQADITSGGTTTSLTNIPGGADPTRFFAVLEKDHRR